MAESVNSSAIREAAEKLVVYLPKFLEAIDYYGIDGYYSSCYKKDLKELHGRIDFLKSALDAPPRNCDVGSPEEQTARLRKFCRKYPDDCQGCPCCPDPHADNCWLVWAQMPYEEAK